MSLLPLRTAHSQSRINSALGKEGGCGVGIVRVPGLGTRFDRCHGGLGSGNGHYGSNRGGWRRLRRFVGRVVATGTPLASASMTAAARGSGALGDAVHAL